MAEIITSAALLGKLDQQEHLLTPLNADENSDFRQALTIVRSKFAEVIAAYGDVSSQDELVGLCGELTRVLPNIWNQDIPQALGHSVGEGVKKGLGQTIKSVRSKVRKEIENQARWRAPAEDRAGQAVNALREALNAFHKFNLPPVETKKLERGLSDAEKNAYRHLATLVNPALLRNLLLILHGDVCEEILENDDDEASLKNYLGITENQVAPSFADFPPEIMIHPRISWFRKILFNAMRDNYLPIFNSPKDGMKKVKQLILTEVQVVNTLQKNQLERVQDKQKRERIMQEHATKRRFLSALLQYFENIENLPHPSRLKNSLGGTEPFPSRHQEIAIAETAMLKRFFNGGEMGVGKTGATIATFEYLREQKDENGKPLATKAVIFCPAGIVKVWNERLCNSDSGYFRHDYTPSVAVINGNPQERRDQWEAAKSADYVVIGTEMSQESTDIISHEEWIKSLGADFMVIDEVHNLRRSSSKATTGTQRIFRISQADSIRYTVLLSGTPIPNNRKDIAAQIRLLNAQTDTRKTAQGIEAFQAFLQKAPVSAEDRKLLDKLDAENKDDPNAIGTIDFHQLNHIVHMINRRDVSLTQQFLLPFLYRPKTQECLPVGTVLHPLIEDVYNLTPKEQVTYDEALTKELAPIMKIQSLQRICLHSNAVEDAPHTGDAKFERLTHWINTFLAEKDHNRKIVVASPHFVEGVTQGHDDGILLRKLDKEYGPKGVRIFMLDGPTGGHKEYKTLTDADGSALSRTKKILAEFRDCNEPAILLSQMDVIREGIDLSFASRGILLAPAWTRSEEEQFWRRMYRRGQEHDVRCVKLITKGTIEEGIHNRAHRKQQIGEKLLSGLQLTSEEMALFDQTDIQNLTIHQETPKQHLNRLWASMMQRGKNFVQSYINAYGQEIADLYNYEWETSHNGNTARLVAGIINCLIEGSSPTCTTDIADIASGSFSIARTMKSDSRVRVHSSDINPAMISEHLGMSILGDAYTSNRSDVCAMDSLPYADGSKDIAVLSMALHYPMHREKPTKQGRERIRTIAETHRILKEEGKAIITLPRDIFHEQSKFQEFCIAMKYFGFEVVSPYSGIAQAKTDNQQQDGFEVAIVTLQKVKDILFDKNANWNDVPKEVKNGLNFILKKTSLTKKEKGNKSKSPVEKEGAYHEAFTINDGNLVKSDILFTSTKEQQAAQERLRANKILFQQSPHLVQVLLRHYRSIDEIPDDTWVQVPLDVIAISPLEVRNVYCEALITHFGASLEEKVLAIINDGQFESSLKIMGTKKGRYIVFCNKEGNPHGRKYFLQTQKAE
ncbi:MAG: methyltransferase domain-containing protein [Candidatus Peribacteraceae bacterium]|nr:methyltransferase domain-containing protein [Candidatus Peribacteraceae bacterium]